MGCGCGKKFTQPAVTSQRPAAAVATVTPSARSTVPPHIQAGMVARQPNVNVVRSAPVPPRAAFTRRTV